MSKPVYLPTRPERKKKLDNERLIKTSLLRDILRVLEGSGYDGAAKLLRGVYGEYE